MEIIKIKAGQNDNLINRSTNFDSETFFTLITNQKEFNTRDWYTRPLSRTSQNTGDKTVHHAVLP